MDYHRSEPLDYNDITENLRTPAWYDLEDDSSLLRDAATAITDLLARAEAAEAANSQLNGTVTTLMESNRKLAEELKAHMLRKKRDGGTGG